MLKFVTGNLFEAGADCLINTVNCEGFMGKGIAYQFKLKFPHNNLDYVKACKTGTLHIGVIHYYKENGIWIINFPTKNKWRENSKIDYIEKGLEQLKIFIKNNNPKTIAIPPLGCGNGGLEWNVVKNLIVEKLKDIENDYNILIFEPSQTYTAKPQKAPDVSVSGLVVLQIGMDLKKRTAIRLQKTGYFINYFMGEEYFKFDKWKFGPYSYPIEIVSRNLKAYQDYFNLSNSKDTYEQIYKVIVSKKTEEKLIKLNPAIEKATKYVNEISSDKKLEGVATVLFIIQKNNQINEERIINKFKEWSDDKAKRFAKKYIKECIYYLENTNIISKNICNEYEVSSKAWK